MCKEGEKEGKKKGFTRTNIQAWLLISDVVANICLEVVSNTSVYPELGGSLREEGSLGTPG